VTRRGFFARLSVLAAAVGIGLQPSAPEAKIAMAFSADFAKFNAAVESAMANLRTFHMMSAKVERQLSELAL
jgi:hypothetical protein